MNEHLESEQIRLLRTLALYVIIPLANECLLITLAKEWRSEMERGSFQWAYNLLNFNFLTFTFK